MGVFSAEKFVLERENGECEAWTRVPDDRPGAAEYAHLTAKFSNRGDAEAWLLGEVEPECVENHADCGGALEVCTDGETRCDIHATCYEYSVAG
jgi:hypothetical protein